MLPDLGVEAVGTGVAAVVGIADMPVAKTRQLNLDRRRKRHPKNQEEKAQAVVLHSLLASYHLYGLTLNL